MRNFYDVLGIAPSADEEQMRDAFHDLAKTFHPDVNPDAQAKHRFIEVSQAYDTLRDPRTRAVYELGLVHQRKNARRRVSAAAMTGFATSMLSTIVISLVMILLLTDGRHVSPGEQDRDVQPKKAVSAKPDGGLHAP